jgi:hypothetical protein
MTISPHPQQRDKIVATLPAESCNMQEGSGKHNDFATKQAKGILLTPTALNDFPLQLLQ